MARMAAFSRIIRQLQLHPGTPVGEIVSLIPSPSRERSGRETTNVYVL